MTRHESVKFVVVRSLGNFLLLFSLYGVGATFGPALWEETQYQIAHARGVTYRVATESSTVQDTNPETIETVQLASPSGRGFADVLAGNKDQILIPKDTNFSIVIPKIGASAAISPNIDPENPGEFLPALQHSIAHAKGTVFPGMPGNVYLFAHSADNWWNVGRYNAVFYLLKNLDPGDEIVVFFEGRRYDYVVREKVITDPGNVSFLTKDHGGPAQLILQTCWPPGTTWQRLFVIAEPKN